MSSNTYILCPGQGAQETGMGKALYERGGLARRAFDQANEVLGFDLAEICFNGPAEKLNQTDISQPAIFVTSVASFGAALNDDIVNEIDSYTFAGLSLGEYTALHLAGVFDFETGLRLVAMRGRLMQEAATRTPSSMVAVIGADESAVNELCEKNASGEVLVPANFNAPGQIVVSGSKAACERFAEAASVAGFRGVPLTVAGAFHSPIMQSAADAMVAELAKAKFHEASGMARSVYSNVTADLHSDIASIKSLLVDQIVKPVRWEQTMAKVANLPDAKFIELAPGKVLTGLLRKQNRRANIQTLGQ